MKQHLVTAGKLFLDRLLFNIVALLLLPFCIAMIDMMQGGPILFSVTVCMLYLGIIYDLLWKVGKHDRQSYATEKYYALKGLVIGLISEIPFLILFLFLAWNPSAQGFFALYRVIAVGAYMGFLPETHFTVGYGLVLLIAPLFTTLGYIVGHRRPDYENKSFWHHIFYRKKKSK